VKTKGGIQIPEELATALRSKPGVLAMWERLRPSCQREHVGSVLDAKRPETRRRRIAAVVEATVEWNERHPGGTPARSEPAAGKREPRTSARRADFGAPVDAFFSRQPAHLRAILEPLRAMVHRAAPDAASSLKWGMPWFSVNGRMMCALTGHKSHVNLVLLGPASAFDDPDGRLSGAGSNGRHLRLASLDDLPRTAVRRWLSAAAKLARRGA
jgi:hypothetical protein